jgi:alcohol-forming fatty acyl-CoA reductase
MFFRWLDVKEISTKIARKYPIKRSLWVITYNTTRFKFIARTLRIFYHFLPSLFVDTLLVVFKREPKLLKLYRKVNKFAEILEFFTTNAFQFDDVNSSNLWHR